MEAVAKVFKIKNSQDLRIPKELRLNTDKVKIISLNDYLIIKPLNQEVRKG